MMPDVFDYAKYLIKQDIGTDKNTFDGNMKLQKLLVLANLVSLAEYDKPLFEDEILAFENGCVIEKVRLRHKNDFFGFIADSRYFNPEFSQDEYDILNLTIAIFGGLSARELSNLNHTFSFWQTAYQNSLQKGGYKDKKSAVVSVDSMRGELDRIKTAITAYRETQNEGKAKEIINGIEFYYTPGEVSLTEDVLNHLYRFSLSADDRAYSVYYDEGSLVVF